MCGIHIKLTRWTFLLNNIKLQGVTVITDEDVINKETRPIPMSTLIGGA